MDNNTSKYFPWAFLRKIRIPSCVGLVIKVTGFTAENPTPMRQMTIVLKTKK